MRVFICILLLPGFISCRKDHHGPPDDNLLSIDHLETLSTNIPAQHYKDLTFTSASTGYALAGTFIAKTTDGGNTWDSIPLPISTSWTRIHFADAMNGFIIGGANNSGFLLKTTDAGETWSVIPLNVIEAPTGIYFLNKDTGFITGKRCFRKTTDGGQTWTSVRTGETGLYWDVRFRDAMNGIATSTLNGDFFRTTDGGNTWDSLRLPGAHHLYGIHFTPGQTLIEKSMDSVVDIGNTLPVMKIPLPVSKLLFIDSKHSIGVGEHYEQGYFPYGDICVSNTGWQSFKQKTYSTSFAIRFTALARMSPNKAMMLGFGFEGTQVLVLEW